MARRAADADLVSALVGAVRGDSVDADGREHGRQHSERSDEGPSNANADGGELPAQVERGDVEDVDVRVQLVDHPLDGLGQCLWITGDSRVDRHAGAR
jgi:hypothetical protein